MRIGEFYSVLALIFANNFNEVINADNFTKIKSSNGWIVKNDRESNQTGAKYYDDFLKNESLAELRTDFRSLKDKFLARNYFASATDDLDKFYKSVKFSPKIGETDSISNQLLFIATILKNEIDEKQYKLLISFLVSFFLPYATLLSKDLQEKAKSSFYKSIGYFLTDFCESLQDTFGIKQG